MLNCNVFLIWDKFPLFTIRYDSNIDIDYIDDFYKSVCASDRNFVPCIVMCDDVAALLDILDCKRLDTLLKNKTVVNNIHLMAIEACRTCVCMHQSSILCAMEKRMHKNFLFKAVDYGVEDQYLQYYNDKCNCSIFEFLAFNNGPECLYELWEELDKSKNVIMKSCMKDVLDKRTAKITHLKMAICKFGITEFDLKKSKPL